MSTGQARPLGTVETYRLSEHSDPKNPLRESWGKEYFHNEELYQALTYAMALDAPAVLVHPRVDRDVDAILSFRNLGVTILGIDLADGCPPIALFEFARNAGSAQTSMTRSL